MELITDLHGNTYKLGDFKLKLGFPKFPNYKSGVVTKDIITGQSLSIVTCDGQRVYMVKYLTYCKLYVVYELEHISYEEKKDIRKAYLHGNIHHS